MKPRRGVMPALYSGETEAQGRQELNFRGATQPRSLLKAMETAAGFGGMEHPAPASSM